MAKKKTLTVGSGRPGRLENQRIKLTQTLSRASVRLGLSLAMTELRKVMSILCYGAGFEGSVSDSSTLEIHQKMFQLILVTNGR